MVETAVAIGLAAVVTALIVVFHFLKGMPWSPREDIADVIMEHRASTLPEYDYPEPMSRAVGAGGGGGAVVTGGEAEGELETGSGQEGEESPAAIPDDEAGSFEIEFLKEDATIEVRENETILEAGEDEGWELPYACREGQCLSCGGHIADGPADDYVVHHNQQMLEQPELDDGYVLTCCAYPKEEFSIETGETP